MSEHKEYVRSKSAGAYWVIDRNRNVIERWCVVKLWAQDGELLWSNETPRYRTGSVQIRERKALTRANTIIANFNCGYEINPSISTNF